ncbi:hypothetical protein MMYC01_203641 [Madurella mycetomatis]|uniref:Uncharacterized protein n=1 Tax=Madurella mycetomatis TaxID=100816 RepID=A0A175W700_9PEZI|nr:hypothetical protein MMYC01_203641 [Madurella mycetomatis]
MDGVRDGAGRPLIDVSTVYMGELGARTWQDGETGFTGKFGRTRLVVSSISPWHPLSKRFLCVNSSGDRLKRWLPVLGLDPENILPGPSPAGVRAVDPDLLPLTTAVLLASLACNQPSATAARLSNLLVLEAWDWLAFPGTGDTMVVVLVITMVRVSSQVTQ